MHGPQGRGRLGGLACPDPDLQEALDAEERCMQQRGTGHSDNAVMLLNLAPTPSSLHAAAAGGHAFALASLLGLGQAHAGAAPISPPPCSPLHQPLTPPDQLPRPDTSPPCGSPLRSSAVGRLLDHISIPPSDEETIVRSLCERLVEYVAYQQAVSELPGITQDLESFQAEVFRSAFAAASSAPAPCGCLREAAPPRPDLLPPLPAASTRALTRTHSLPDRPVCPHAAPLKPQHIPQASPGAPALHSNTSSTQLPTSTRPPRPGRTLPPLARQASCPESPLAAGPTTQHRDREGMPLHTTSPHGGLNPQVSCPSISSHLPPILTTSTKRLEHTSSLLPSGPPSSPAPSRSCKQPLSSHPPHQPLPHSPSQPPRFAPPHLSVVAATAPACSCCPAKPQQMHFISLTAYMMHMLGPGSKQQQQQQEEQGNSSGRARGRRASAGLCQEIQERVISMSREQMDTVRTESKSNARRAAAASGPALLLGTSS